MKKISLSICCEHAIYPFETLINRSRTVWWTIQNEVREKLFFFGLEELKFINNNDKVQKKKRKRNRSLKLKTVWIHEEKFRIFVQFLHIQNSISKDNTNGERRWELDRLSAFLCYWDWEHFWPKKLFVRMARGWPMRLRRMDTDTQSCDFYRN